MRAIALKLLIIWGWRRMAVCLAAGAVSALAMEPLSLLPVLFVTIPILVWTLDGASVQAETRAGAARRGFFIGLWFGTGFFLTGIHWVGSAFLIDADQHAWLMAPILGGLAVLLALFWGIGCAVASVFWTHGLSRLFVFAAALSGTEWLRGVVLTGFPWNTPGHAVAASPELVQIASFVGVSGLNLIVLLVAASPALLGDEPAAKDPRGLRNWSGFAALLILFGGLWNIGRYTLDAELPAQQNEVRVRIVQPNIAQKEKWVAANRQRIFASYLELSDAATSPEVSGISDVDVLIWPESAPPFLIERDDQALAQIDELLGEGTVLITGALHAEPSVATQNARQTTVFNSVLAFDDKGAVIARYDKAHLVPFGEYIPYEETFASLGIRKLVKLPGSFGTGPGARTVDITGIPPFSPLICYEIAFAGQVVERGNRPAWLLNVTNDAWFGDSAGPRQHIQHARFRAVEQGLPVLRSANTGISAVIDARGRIVKHLPVGVSGVIDTPLPAALPETLYAAHGDLGLAVLIAGLLLLAAVTRRRRQQDGQSVEFYGKYGSGTL